MTTGSEGHTERFERAIVASNTPDNKLHLVRPFRWAEREFRDAAPDPGAVAASPEGAVPTVSPAEQAEQLLAEAKGQAQAILATARKQATTVRETARKEGLAEGRAAASKEAAAAAKRLQGLFEALAAYKPSLYTEAHQQVVELTLALVHKILGPLAAASSDAVVRVVERALQLLSDREQLTIRVHPDDLKTLIDAKPQLLGSVDGIQRLTVLEDPSVKPGGCLVQTPTTEIDARLDTQLQELARSLRSL